jgi:hypothetical protein
VFTTPAGSVQEHVRELLLRELLAVEADVVGSTDERVQLSRLAVDRDATGLDQLVGLPAGRHPRAGEPGIQTHCVIVARRDAAGGPGAADARRRTRLYLRLIVRSPEATDPREQRPTCAPSLLRPTVSVSGRLAGRD